MTCQHTAALAAVGDSGGSLRQWRRQRRQWLYHLLCSSHPAHAPSHLPLRTHPPPIRSSSLCPLPPTAAAQRGLEPARRPQSSWTSRNCCRRPWQPSGLCGWHRSSRAIATRAVALLSGRVHRACQRWATDAIMLWPRAVRKRVRHICLSSSAAAR